LKNTLHRAFKNFTSVDLPGLKTEHFTKTAGQRFAASMWWCCTHTFRIVGWNGGTTLRGAYRLSPHFLESPSKQQEFLFCCDPATLTQLVIKPKMPAFRETNY